MITVKLGRASAGLVLCATLNAATGRRRPFSSRFPRSSNRATASTARATRLLTRIWPSLGLGTEPGGEIAYGSDRGIAGAVGKADLAQCRVTLRDAGTKAQLTIAAAPVGD